MHTAQRVLHGVTYQGIVFQQELFLDLSVTWLDSLNQFCYAPSNTPLNRHRVHCAHSPPVTHVSHCLTRVIACHTYAARCRWFVRTSHDIEVRCAGGHEQRSVIARNDHGQQHRVRAVIQHTTQGLETCQQHVPQLGEQLIELVLHAQSTHFAEHVTPQHILRALGDVCQRQLYRCRVVLKID